LEQDTHGPYTITAKENGCIVFIAAVSPTELVVTSKHMIPDPQDDPTSHGGVGYRWLLHHLASAHQAPATLAAWLHKFRVTMVAELCDDDFEEHVVPYTTRGLYLHGINYNTTTLHTLPIDQVQTIGHHFGFHTIHHQKVSSFATLRSFVDDAQRMHQVMNENESEGIVIRCKRDSTAAMDFFFKVKYETYLMYREYREITKALVDIQQQQQQQDGDDGKITVVVRRRRGNKKLKIRFDRSLYYILWLQERVVDHPEWFYDYSRNKGIIAVRQAFEQDWKEGRLEGADIGAVQDWVERVHW
jgi:tRNA splicing ligase